MSCVPPSSPTKTSPLRFSRRELPSSPSSPSNTEEPDDVPKLRENTPSTYEIEKKIKEEKNGNKLTQNSHIQNKRKISKHGKHQLKSDFSLQSPGQNSSDLSVCHPDKLTNWLLN
jgi:hypothetical protein